MRKANRRKSVRCVGLLLASLLLAAGIARPAEAQTAAQIAVVKPVMDCSALAHASLRQAVGVDVALQASTVTTAQGTFCHVTGVIAPSIHLEVDLPAERWTQRLLQAGCGGLCGNINASIGNAYGCQPALNGEFVVAASDLGHQTERMGGAGEGDFAEDPQKRIDFAYRANHLTALTAKALIKIYYAQPQRFSYFSGCSDGGREAMMEAERYPEDFDGISAGAPAMYFQVQNSLNHAWTQYVNMRPDGSRILQGAKLEVLHTAVIDHCDTLDGVKDGLLTDPRACKVEASWVECTSGAADRTGCLTHEEWTVASKLYEGATDEQGQHFLPGGWQPGSELQWGGGGPPAGARPPQQPAKGGAPQVGAPPRTAGPGGGMVANMAPVVFPVATPADTNIATYPFTMEQFRRAVELHGLNDAVDTDLRPFAVHGGKLIVYHGWSDTSIAPLISVAYYTAVQRDLGTANVDKFYKLFMIPGMGHCGGGDGFSQFDTLSPLMAWVEGGEAPAMLDAGKLAPVRGMAAGPDGRGGGRQTAPFAQPAKPVLASRPIYPFPQIAHATGANTSSATDFVEAPSDVKGPATQTWIGSELLAPVKPPPYTVHDGKLVRR